MANDQFTADTVRLQSTSSSMTSLASHSQSTVGDLATLILDVLSFAQIGGTVAAGNASLHKVLVEALGKLTEILSDVGNVVGESANGYADADQAVAQALGGEATAADDPVRDLISHHHKGDRGVEVKQLQQQLTAAGYDTHGADGVWGRNTEDAVAAYLRDHPREGFTSPDGFNYERIRGVSNNPNVTPEFLRKIETISTKLGTKPEYLMAAMSFESGETFSPSVKNPHSSATGLIQFMNSTAHGLGTTTADLSQMTPVQQLDYVDKYFEPYKGKVDTLEGVYTSILSGRPHSDPDTVLFTQGSDAYRVNSGLDANHDGNITTYEAAAKVRAKIRD